MSAFYVRASLNKKVGFYNAGSCDRGLSVAKAAGENALSCGTGEAVDSPTIVDRQLENWKVL
jgi:uncharacterized membrane protein